MSAKEKIKNAAEAVKPVVRRVWGFRPLRIAIYTAILGACGYALTPEQAVFLDAIFTQ